MKKTNPWPIGIILFLVSFATLVITAGVLISRQHYELVRSDYYAHEIAYEDHLEAIRRANTLPDKPTITADASQQMVVIDFPADLIPKVHSPTLHLYYPANQDHDQHLTVEFDEFGKQRIPFPPDGKGNWKAELQWTMDAELYITGGRLFL